MFLEQLEVFEQQMRHAGRERRLVRHGIGHNLFSYHRSPNGFITELFAELDQLKDESLGYFEPRPWHRDNPQRPKTWPKTPEAANLWGPLPPDEMME